MLWVAVWLWVLVLVSWYGRSSSRWRCWDCGAPAELGAVQCGSCRRYMPGELRNW
jgi:hypothetical protein